jgi:hypothetical protein
VVDYSPPASRSSPSKTCRPRTPRSPPSGSTTSTRSSPTFAAATSGRIPVLEATASAEGIRDTIGTALVAGTGITVTVDDPGDTITIANSGASYTAENARDDIGTALVAGAGISITVDDAGDTITLPRWPSTSATPSPPHWSQDPGSP